MQLDPDLKGFLPIILVVAIFYLLLFRPEQRKRQEHARMLEALKRNDRVTMTGLIPRDEVFLRCASADVLVSTSHGEGLPVAVIEAMAAGCPVILSDIPPHRELMDGEDFVPLEIGRAHV